MPTPEGSPPTAPLEWNASEWDTSELRWKSLAWISLHLRSLPLRASKLRTHAPIRPHQLYTTRSPTLGTTESSLPFLSHAKRTLAHASHRRDKTERAEAIEIHARQIISKDASSDSVPLSRVGCSCALTGSMPRSASVHSLILLPSMCSCFPTLRGSFSSSTLGSPPLKRGSSDGGGSAARTHHPLARSLARSCVLCPSLLPSPPSPIRSLLPSWPT